MSPKGRAVAGGAPFLALGMQAGRSSREMGNQPDPGWPSAHSGEWTWSCLNWRTDRFSGEIQDINSGNTRGGSRKWHGGLFSSQKASRVIREGFMEKVTSGAFVVEDLLCAQCLQAYSQEFHPCNKQPVGRYPASLMAHSSPTQRLVMSSQKRAGI